MRDNEMKLRLTEILLNIETIYHIPRYYIYLQIAVTQHLIYITSRCIYSKLLMTLFLN